jgi:hypothetical protein
MAVVGQPTAAGKSRSYVKTLEIFGAGRVRDDAANRSRWVSEHDYYDRIGID